ncbi:MAG TPA: peptidoglycan recognition family protein [Planctomycetota bacterium]|nr:peptidoglycan recognition family protein [Planctomycetota bacterium]
MKPFDLLLLSVAIGLTSFTTYMFCTGGAPIEAAAPDGSIPPLTNPAFRSIVIHHSATHGGSAAAFERNHRARLGGLAYHFVIGNGSGAADGAVEVGYRWRDQIPGPHTKNQDINLESIAICLVGDFEKEAPTKKQVAALVELLERLCREGHIPADRVRSHREVDAETLCPGRGLPVEAIRATLAVRLSAVPARLVR